MKVALTARLRYGPDLTPAATYVATAGRSDHRPCDSLTQVLPAEARDNVVLDLGIDNWKHERAVFTGSIAAG